MDIPLSFACRGSVKEKPCRLAGQVLAKTILGGYFFKKTILLAIMTIITNPSERAVNDMLFA
jgi:hypothetical protein